MERRVGPAVSLTETRALGARDPLPNNSKGTPWVLTEEAGVSSSSVVKAMRPTEAGLADGVLAC